VTKLYQCLRIGLIVTVIWCQPELCAQKKAVAGTEFANPIYLPMSEASYSQKGVGDLALRRHIIYATHLQEGDQLSASISSTAPGIQSEEKLLVLMLVNGKPTELQDANVVYRTTSTAQHGTHKATLTYNSPIDDDFYLVAEFNASGLAFEITTSINTSGRVPHSVSCTTGLISHEPSMNGDRISDMVIGEPDLTGPDDHNRHVCVAACQIQPPSLRVLTETLKVAFSSKREVRVCWNSSNIVGEVVLSAVPAKLSASEAGKHVGEAATVCGVAASVHTATSSKGSATFISLNKPYPNQLFTILISGSDLGKFAPSPSSWTGKQVCATGTISLYRNVPEIVARDAGQISFPK
jgi:hypothetical protein